jgi:hypothetical protein
MIHSLLLKVCLYKLVLWRLTNSTTTGSVKLAAMKCVAKKRVRESFALSATQACRAVNYSSYSPHSIWFKGKEVVSDNLDECAIGSWIFAKSPIDVNIIFAHFETAG